MFTCDWCISIHFVCFCLSRFVACDRPVLANSWPVFFKYFSDLSYSCLLKNKAISASCPLQKYHSSSQFPSLFLRSLESFSVLFLWAKLGECMAWWLTLTPPHSNDWWNRKTHSKFANVQRDTTNLAISGRQGGVMVSVLTLDQEVRVHAQPGQCVWRLLDLLVVSTQSCFETSLFIRGLNSSTYLG